MGVLPYIGSTLDIYEGTRDGNWTQFGFGVVALGLDLAFPFSGSLLNVSVKVIGKELAEEGLELAAKDLIKEVAYEGGENVLRHYINEVGYNAIMESGQLLPSVGIKNATHGSGQYFTDLMSNDLTSGQVSRRLFGVP